MSLIPAPSPLDAGIEAGAIAAHHLAVTIKAGHEGVYNRPIETILADLNADVAKAAQIMQLSEQASLAVNALLDAVNDDRFPTRAPTTMPTGFAFDGSQFTFTPPVIDPPAEP